MTPIIALLAFASPIRLQISVPAQVTAGNEVPVVVLAKNVSNRPITLVKASPFNSRLGLRWQTHLVHDGKEVLRDEKSGWIAQINLGGLIRPEQFMVVAPGEAVEIYRDKFSKLFKTGEIALTKQNYYTAPRADLAPGQYTFRASFGFQRKIKEDKSPLRPAFVPEAKGRYVRAWTGQLNAEATFKVVE